MSQQNIYPVQLLNDIHNYFPDILYNPGRFRTVHDLLDYIRSVADVNPYTRGLNNYNIRQTQNMATNRTNTRPRVAPINPANGVNVSWIPNLRPSTTQGLPEQINSTFQIPINDHNNIMSTLLGSLINPLIDVPIIGGGLQTFLEQRVHIRPSNEEIENASNTYVATRQEDDNCAICQDTIERGQRVRRLLHCNHYFHSVCIDTWFGENVHCPTCRHDIREVTQNVRNADLNQGPGNNNSPPPVPENHRRTNINE
jgi:hypothetical protein